MDSGSFTIFLDIDGVLARFGPDSYPKLEDFLSPRCWDRGCLLNLATLCLLTDAEVVISSTWRQHYKEPEWWNREFANLGYYIDVIGITPKSYKRNETRGDEIQDYINKNNISTFVILDDDSDMLADQKPFFIKTNVETGLTMADVELALKIYNAGMV